jgi:hypothetical protein
LTSCTGQRGVAPNGIELQPVLAVPAGSVILAVIPVSSPSGDIVVPQAVV